MTNMQILHAAVLYSQSGNWRTVAGLMKTAGTRDWIRKSVQRESWKNPAIAAALEQGRIKSCHIHTRQTDKEIEVRPDLAFKRDREIYAMRVAQPSPVTFGQKYMGEPLPGRSALEHLNGQIETDERGNITKRQPRIMIGAISIPDIHINSHAPNSTCPDNQNVAN